MPDSPKKRGRSPGNGAGWGGPAKGAGWIAKTHPPFEQGNQMAKGYHDMSRSERLAALDERKWQIAMGLQDVEPVALAALNSYEDRHMGKAKQALTIGGDQDGAPLKNEIMVTFRKTAAE